MGTSQLRDSAFFVQRQQGAQQKYDINAIAGELAQCLAGDAGLRVLFDWSEVHDWPFEAPSAAAIAAWNEKAPLIARAAIVHDQTWKRHAAFLAALLWMRNAEVRSFRPSDYDKAIEWLGRGPRVMEAD
jgi:hypothetical protein